LGSRIYFDLNFVRMAENYIIATIGFPGSGKTHFSEKLAKKFNLVHLNSDKFRFEIYGEDLSAVDDSNQPIFNLMNWVTEELLKKRIGVIYDTNSNKIIYRKKFAKFAKKYNALYILVHLKTPLEIAEQRILKRGKLNSKEKNKYYRQIDISELNRFKNEIELPLSNEPVIEIDGTLSFVEQVRIFSDGVRKLYQY